MSCSDSAILLEASRARASGLPATGCPEHVCCMCSTGFPTGEFGSVVDSRSTSFSNSWATRAVCSGSTQLGSTGGIELVNSHSWSSASTYTAAGSRGQSGDSHPVILAERCSAHLCLRSKRVNPRLLPMTSFSSTWSRSHRGTGLKIPSTMDKKLAHSGVCIAVSEFSGT